MNPLRTLSTFGQSLWYDNIYRAMIRSGELASMIKEDGLKGITSNPTIFEKAITGSSDYDAALSRLLEHNAQQNARDLFFSLAIEDIQAAADLMLPVYREANGHDGLVSLEVSPDLAYDTKSTIAEAKKLWKRVDRPNLMIKVPATQEGLPAVEELIDAGINVNVTLLFAVERYRDVVDAYLSGLERRMRRGQPISQIASVASFFVSRVDSALDKLFEEHSDRKAKELVGKIAVANAKLAYSLYEDLYASARFEPLQNAGARAQRLLWASTGTKSAKFSDVLYIEELIGRDTVTTVPPATYAAYKDHGKPKATLSRGIAEAKQQVDSLKALGINLKSVTDQLENEGVKSFAKSFDTLLGAIESKSKELRKKASTHA